MKRRLSLAFRAASLGLLVTATAAAQAPPDVVTTKDGGMLRGTIIEKVPGQYVDITLANGETRRIPMDQVVSAGPAGSGGGQAVPPAARDNRQVGVATVHGAEARLKLTSPQVGVGFHNRVGSSYAVAYGYGGSAVARGRQYADLCVAPCEISMPSGTYNLALSSDGGYPVETGAVTVPAGGATLEGEYESYSGMRAVGWTILISSTLVGLTLMMWPLLDTDSLGEDGLPASFWIGTGIAVVGPLVSIPFLAKADEAYITVHPYNAASKRSKFQTAQANAVTDNVLRRQAPGMAFSGIF